MRAIQENSHCILVDLTGLDLIGLEMPSELLLHGQQRNCSISSLCCRCLWFFEDCRSQFSTVIVQIYRQMAHASQPIPVIASLNRTGVFKKRAISPCEKYSCAAAWHTKQRSTTVLRSSLRVQRPLARSFSCSARGRRWCVVRC